MKAPMTRRAWTIGMLHGTFPATSHLSVAIISINGNISFSENQGLSVVEALSIRLILPATGVALAAATLPVQAAPVTLEAPAPGVEAVTPMAALPLDPLPPSASRPAGSAAVLAPSRPIPLKDSATGALLEDLRRHAGIAAPGSAQPAPTASAAGERSSPGQVGIGDVAAGLDPELKEALKEARDWVKEALPGADTRVNPALDSDSRTAVSNGAAPESEAGETNADPALRRAEMAVAQPDAPQRDETVPGGIPIVAELLQLVRDLLLHPATWLALGLALLLKVTLAMVAMRSRRRVHQRRAGRRAGSAHTIDQALPSAAKPASDLGPSQRPRRTSRHGQRHRRQ
jgi:hypothetical protein